jgi:hypothetical protein
MHPTQSPFALLLALLVLLPVAPSSAAEIEGVRFAEAHRTEGGELRLHGVGLLRYRIVVKAYVAALYLTPGADPREALGDAPRRLEIEYFWPIAASDFAGATREGIARNVPPDRRAALAERIERIATLYRDVGPGDRYALTYLPGTGTELSRNGERLGVIPGADFAAAIFAIWLGDEPLDASLKAQLLRSS